MFATVVQQLLKLTLEKEMMPWKTNQEAVSMKLLNEYTQSENQQLFPASPFMLIWLQQVVKQLRNSMKRLEKTVTKYHLTKFHLIPLKCNLIQLKLSTKVLKKNMIRRENLHLIPATMQNCVQNPMKR